jgi:hypothetical protein
VQFGDHGARLWPRPAKLGFGQISAQADFLVVRHHASEWSTFFEKHKGFESGGAQSAKLPTASVTLMVVFFTKSD